MTSSLLRATYLQMAKKFRVDMPRISTTELKSTFFFFDDVTITNGYIGLVIAKFVENGITSLADARAADHYGL